MKRTGSTGLPWAGVAVAVALGLALLTTVPRLPAETVPPRDAAADAAFAVVVQKTASMVADPEARQLADRHKLNVLNLTWEDAGRFKNSAVGPNISDMTIQVPTRDARGQDYLTCMPVIRTPNFEDKTCDVPPDRFFLLVGNEKGVGLRRVSLREYLANPRRYLSKPGSWKGDATTLLCNRDTHVLVSPQACFLPVPKEGLAEFNPVLFNYQSMPGDPAVLAILATREGTSATVIDNERDRFAAGGGAWGQQLYFNLNGERARFTGQRLSDFQAGLIDKSKPGPAPEAGQQKGLNMVLLIQVPLKQKERPRPFGGGGDVLAENSAPKGEPPADPQRRSDVEAAVIGHGKAQGPFTEIADLPIERDPRFPVRVTVQFYKATSNGVVSAKDMEEIAAQLQQVYDSGDFVGSLVTDGHTARPTEHDGEKVETLEWWADFWERRRQQFGLTRAEVIAELKNVKGEAWFPMTEQELGDEADAHVFAANNGLRRFWLRFGAPLVVGVVLAAVLFLAVVAYRRRSAAAAA
jgi:hypothetical protein